MPTKLPLDTNDNPIPALRLKDSGAHTISTSITSARNTLAFSNDTKIISLYATQDVYINFGDSTVVATNSDHFFPANTYYDIAIGDESTGHNAYIATLRDSADGTLYISEKE